MLIYILPGSGFLYATFSCTGEEDGMIGRPTGLFPFMEYDQWKVAVHLSLFWTMASGRWPRPFPFMECGQ